MGFWDEVNRQVDEKAGIKKEKSNYFDKGFNGAHIHNLKKVCKGYRFFEGHLINIQGTIVKKFAQGHLGTFADNHYVGQTKYEQGPWSLIDSDNKRLFSKKRPIHHECFVHDDVIMTFDKEVQTYRGRQVDFDAVVAFDFSGKELWRWSMWENRSKLKKHHGMFELDIPFIPIGRKEKSPWGGEVDYYRLNSLQFLPKNPLTKKNACFAEGNWLLTLRHGSLLLVLDKKTKDVVWKLSQKDLPEEIQGPHGAQMLSSGNILLFDNGRYRGWSRVIEFNPLTKEIIWEFRSDDMYTKSQGYAQRLSNGNTLITISEQGRAFEVTAENEIVWEYYYPLVQSEKNMPQYQQSWGKRMWMYRMIWYSQTDVKNFLK